VNYDIPYDSEAYIHRIGRTGRAGRRGHAILFVTPREQHLLKSIERATGQRIGRIALPSPEDITNQRIQRFKQKIVEAIPNTPKQFFDSLVINLCNEMGETPESLAATLAYLLQHDRPLQAPPEPKASPRKERPSKERARKERPVRDRPQREKPAQEAHRRQPQTSPQAQTSPQESATQEERKPRRRELPNVPLELYRLEVGSAHAVTPSDIVGAIANEADVDSQYFGRIDIQENFSTVELPEGMPKEVLKHLKKVWVRNQKLNISRIEDSSKPSKAKPNFKKPGSAKPGSAKRSSEKRGKQTERAKK
ncbi:MAG: DbpA RNA binding domain-containing protein, partial [Pseudomonadales bacterium]|nr:DbpA RNA binding domain-containing protein [Pseudomonadales bacterium]